MHILIGKELKHTLKGNTISNCLPLIHIIEKPTNVEAKLTNLISENRAYLDWSYIKCV